MMWALGRRLVDLVLVMSAAFLAVFAVAAPLSIASRPAACAHLTVSEAVFRALRAWGALQPDACFGQSAALDVALGDAFALRVAVSAGLIAPALVVGGLLGVAFATFAATRAGTRTDRLVMAVAVFGAALPSCVLAPLLIEGVAVRLGFLPILAGSASALLPGLTLALMPAAAIARRLRGDLVRQYREPYVGHARALGFSEAHILWRRVLPGAIREGIGALPALLASLLAGAVVVETVFLRSGLGDLFLRAAILRDSNVLAALVLWGSGIVLLVHHVLDAQAGAGSVEGA